MHIESVLQHCIVLAMKHTPAVCQVKQWAKLSTSSVLDDVISIIKPRDQLAGIDSLGQGVGQNHQMDKVQIQKKRWHSMNRTEGSYTLSHTWLIFAMAHHYRGKNHRRIEQASSDKGL